MYMTEDLKALFMEHADAYANAKERDGKAGVFALTATGRERLANAREYAEAVRAGYEAVRQANEHRAALEAMFDTMIDLTNGQSGIEDVECVLIAKGA